MMPSITNWFKGLSPLQKVAVGVGTCALGSLLVWWKLGWEVFFLALAAVLIVVVLLLFFQKVLNQIWRAKGKDMEGEILGDIKKANAEIGERFDLAFRDLKTNGVDIYRLPWFLWVGEPGGGKSYTIKKSGLDFPLGEEEISGAGGTRNVDFWFTEYAVILDTAGRLTIQEDNPVLDIAQWNEFLRLLRTSRINCPINGVLIGIPCTSLLSEDAVIREKKAAKIQTRLRDLMKALQIHFPVWVIVLKTDLVMGFEQFCSRLPSLERKQLFGWSKEGPFDRPFDPVEFDKAFDGVYQELHRWRLRFLNEELSPETADQLYLFPEEFHALKSSLGESLKRIFGKLDKKKEADREEVYKQPGFFRGIYFTSSLQAGSSIPNAIRGLLEGVREQNEKAEAGLEIEASSTPTFVRDLYAEKVFEEKGLVLRTDRSRLMNTLIRGASLWGGVSVLALGLFFIGARYFLVKPQLEGARERIEQIATSESSGSPGHLEHLTALGLRIEEWETNKEEVWALRSLFKYFSPSPSHDPLFLERLKGFHNRFLLQAHLLPFLAGVQAEIRGSSPGSRDGSAGALPSPTWKDFISRSRRFVRLLEIGLNLKSPLSRANPKSNFKELFGPREEADTSPASYGHQLAAAYERYLTFGGRAESLRPGSPNTYWDDIKETATRLTTLLVAFLEKGEFQAGSSDPRRDFGVRFDDDLRWWRGLLHKCDAFNMAYSKLLSISPGTLPGTLGKPEISNLADFNRTFKERWLDHSSGFNAVNSRWNELQAYIKPSRVLPNERLEHQFQSLKRQIDDFYHTQCHKVLSEAVDDKAKELNGVLSGCHENVKATFAAFRSEFEKQLNASSHLVSYLEETAKPIPTGSASDPSAPSTFTGVTLREEVAFVLSQLKGLDELLRKEPQTILNATTIREGRADSIDNIPATLASSFKSLSMAVDKEPGHALNAFWKQAGLKNLVHAGTVGAVSHLANEVFHESYFKPAKEQVAKNGGKTLAIDHWFKVPSDVHNPVRGTLLERNSDLDGLYQKVCHDRLKNHIGKLKQLLKDNATVYPAVQEGINAGLFDLMLGYEHRFLDHWEEKLNRLHLSFERGKEEEKNWKSFQDAVLSGFDENTPLSDLAHDVVNTIRKSHEEIADVIKDKRAPGYEWARALTVYDEAKLSKLGEKLKNFSKLLKETQDPVAGLEAVYGPESKWLSTDDLNIPKADIFIQKLNALSDQGKSILASECWKQFREDWQDMRAKSDNILRVEDPQQQGHFTIQFPFTGRAYADFGCNFIDPSQAPQVSPREFLSLLGKQQAISAVIERYEFFLNYGEKIPGFEIPPKILTFLRNCRSLRRLLVEDEKGTLRPAIKFNLAIPSHESVQIIEDKPSIYKLWPWSKWKIGNVERKFTLSVDDPLKEVEWRPPKRELADSEVFGFHVLETKEDESPIVKRGRAPGENVRCVNQLENEAIELKLEAKGAWSLILFLQAYGKADVASAKRWLVQYNFPKMVEFSQDHNALVYDNTLVYFELEFVDKQLEELPDWGAVREELR